jgi:hypothetical protein
LRDSRRESGMFMNEVDEDKQKSCPEPACAHDVFKYTKSSKYLKQHMQAAANECQQQKWHNTS